MASAFKTATAVNVGTSLTTVYTCPSATTVTIIGLYLANQSGGAIEGTVEFYDASTTNHVTVLKSSPIPSSSTVVAVGGEGKIVMEAGDSLIVQASAANSLDTVACIMEIT